MNKNIPIGQKRGLEVDSIESILVKADIDSISHLFTEYFGLKVYSGCNLKKYSRLYNQYIEKGRKP